MKPLVSLIFSLLFTSIFAQQLPPSVRWYEMETPHLRLIYPEHFETYAKKIGGYLESRFNSLVYPHDIRVKRIPVILNPYTSVSNAYVSLAPRKSEWYMQPYHKLYFGSVAWYKDLSNHEYRHVVQFDVINRGFVKLGHLFFGDLGRLAVSAFIYPLWYFEGDAVDTETELSQGGRGRSGAFAMPVRMISNAYDKKDLNYYKIYLGSYKRFYPSHYHLGYYLKKYLKENYNDTVWNHIVTKAAWYPLAGGFHASLWFNTGLTYKDLTYKALNGLKMNENPPFPPALPIKRPGIYTHDLFPHRISKDSLLFLRYGFDDTPAVYLKLSTGKTKKITSLPTPYFSANKRHVTWTEYQPHPRWHKQTYTRVAVFDIKSGKKFYLTRPGKYQSPKLSPNSGLLAVVKYDLNLVPHIEIWNVNKRQRIQDVSLENFESVRHPSFATGENAIVFTGLIPDKGTGIYKLDIKRESKPQMLFPPTFQNINYPVLIDNKLYFQSDPEQHDVQLYQVDTENRKTYQLTRAPYGIDTYQVTPDSIIYAVYSEKGFYLTASEKTGRMYQMPSLSHRPLPAGNTVSYLTDTFRIKKFNRFKSYFNPHSWAFFALPESDSVFVAGGALVMNDILDESALSVGGQISNSGDYSLFVNWEWKRYYPVTGLRFSMHRHSIFPKFFKQITGYVKLPLDLSSGIWSRSFVPVISVSALSDNRQHYVPVRLGLQYSVYRQRAYRHVGARWAFGFSGLLAYETQTQSNKTSAFAFVQFPGLGKNDNFRLHFRYEAPNHPYPFTQNVLPVRGMNPYYFNLLNSAGITYHAPLAYPEAGWYRVFYLKRLRYKLFADYATTELADFGSVGLQLIGDWNLSGFKFDVPLGVQIAYVKPFNEWTWSLVIMDIGF